MIRSIPGDELGRRVVDVYPEAIQGWAGGDVWVHPRHIAEVCRMLRDAEDLGFNLLNSISAVDYVEYFEIVYHITSTTNLHSAVLKADVYGRDHPSIPSVVGVWQGADFQEREVWDLMGVAFEEHPNLKRILLWEGYPGFPLRKDYLESPR